MSRHKQTGWVTRPRVALLSVLALASLSLGLYALAAALAAPTITSKPPNPTNQQSAMFTYKHKSSVTFQCALDGSSYTPCGAGKSGTKSYLGPLPSGSHTFQVRAVLGSQTSAAASYTWVIDTEFPSVVSIDRTGSTPTRSASVSWKATFSESVTSVGTDDFAAVTTGGISNVTISVVGSGAVYTVTASMTATTGTIRLDLVDNDSIKDIAGNRLGGTGAGNGNLSGQTYTIDRVAPPDPVITQHPPDPSSTPVSTFAWTDSEGGVSFECAIDSGERHPCSSPYTFTVSTSNNRAEHVFKVRALDAAGNTSSETTFGWKVSRDIFLISGDVSDLLPGIWRPIDVTITNTNNYAITVNQISVAVSSSPAECPASTNLEIQQSPISDTHTVVVGAGATVTLTGTDRPQIQLVNLPVNQDACQAKSFGLQYGGTAIH